MFLIHQFSIPSILYKDSTQTPEIVTFTHLSSETLNLSTHMVKHSKQDQQHYPKYTKQFIREIVVLKM